jgi:hypothetical protein
VQEASVLQSWLLIGCPVWSEAAVASPPCWVSVATGLLLRSFAPAFESIGLPRLDFTTYQQNQIPDLTRQDKKKKGRTNTKEQREIS